MLVTEYAANSQEDSQECTDNFMDQITDHSKIKRTVGPSVARPVRTAASVVAAVVLILAAGYFGFSHYRGGGQVAPPQAAPPPVTVSKPL